MFAPPPPRPKLQRTMSAHSSHIKTRFLILSDTHNASPLQNEPDDDCAFRPPLPKADVLLHCGDLTMIGRMHEHEEALEMLKGIDADLKLVIAGNHDISLDEKYYERKGQYMQRLKVPDEDMPRRARELWTGERAREAGVTYLDEGTYSFALGNGAKLRVGLPVLDERRTRTQNAIGLCIALPARVLRLGLPVLPGPRPLQPTPPKHAKQRPHRRKTRPRLPSHRRDDDTRSAHGHTRRDHTKRARGLPAPSASGAAV